MDIQKIIAATPLFEGLPETQCETIGRIAVLRQFRKGEKIFSEGDPGAGFYVVVSGKVKVYKISPEGKMQIFHIFGKGEVFGEVSVFTGQGYPANAEAQEKSAALFLPRRAFVGLIEKDPSLALNMLATLSWRLHRFAGLIEDLSLKEVPGRLASYLLFLSGQQDGSDDLVLEVSKGQLASLLGTIPETLSRILNKMTRMGLIRTERSSIRLIDRRGLERIAGGERLDTI